MIFFPPQLLYRIVTGEKADGGDGDGDGGGGGGGARVSAAIQELLP